MARADLRPLPGRVFLSSLSSRSSDLHSVLEKQPDPVPVTLPSFNPATLLNPKGANRKSTSRKEVSPTPSRTSVPGSTTMKQINSQLGLERGNSNPRSLIENLYGIQHRSEQPRKKQKISNTTEDAKPSQSRQSHTHHSTGIVGKYLKPDEDKITTASDLQKLVDLTGSKSGLMFNRRKMKPNKITGDDEDEIQVISSRNLYEEQEVCFGQVTAIVHAHQVPKPRSTAQTMLGPGHWPPIKCTLKRNKSKDTIIEVADPFDVVFGKINHELAAVLAPAIDELPKLRTQPRLLNRRKKESEWPHQSCSEQFQMVINLYGRRIDAVRIGKVFGQHNIWFRNPLVADAHIPIENPHGNKHVTPLQQKLAGRNSVLPETRTIEEATEAVTKLFDHFADSAVPLAETEAPDLIQTPLLTHQKQALTFLLQHERPRTFGTEEVTNSSLWRAQQNKKGQTIYTEVVSGVSVSKEPEQVFGGLLADVMGLGKSLEALSLIASTNSEAETFGKDKVVRKTEEEAHVVVSTKATLIVCPTSTVKNWEDQINEHVKPSALTYHIYHGSNRSKNPYELSKFDIVITTYGILSSEFSGRGNGGAGSVLSQLNWFRIVLDEAHTIRESKAIQSRAACSLSAQRRWCLTGTPIQNRIDDLGSLTRFLRMYPYDTAMRFNQYIRAPAQVGDASFLKSLRVFVDSFTLRRLKDRIHLPKRQDLVELLPFSHAERKLHDYFKDIANIQIEELTRNKKTTSGVQHHVLRGILTLRLICAHGKDLLKERDLERLKGITPGEAIDLDDDVVTRRITKQEAYQAFALMAEADLDLCRNCDKRIGGDSPRAEADEDEDGARGYVLPCLDLICPECFASHKRIFEEAGNSRSVECPFCTLDAAGEFVAITGSGLDIDEPPIEPVQIVKPAYSGPHKKTLALLRDIEEMKTASKPLEEQGEPPLKCVVFSEFTSHLDLIGRALTDRGYTFTRIDGTMSLNQRKKVLDALANDDKVTILLASIKAAGQGLNLTSASRAFIMEPMWNPAAEAQAVDRIYRIGQNREVVVKRFQMADSIEGKIVELQRRKQTLADVSLNQNHKQLSKKEVREQHMKDILALFK